MSFDPKALKLLYLTFMDTVKKMEVVERCNLLERLLGTYCRCGEKLSKGQCPKCDFFQERTDGV